MIKHTWTNLLLKQLLISELMNSMTENLHTHTQTFFFYTFLNLIHPFRDGRTCKILFADQINNT